MTWVTAHVQKPTFAKVLGFLLGGGSASQLPDPYLCLNDDTHGEQVQWDRNPGNALEWATCAHFRLIQLVTSGIVFDSPCTNRAISHKMKARKQSSKIGFGAASTKASQSCIHGDPLPFPPELEATFYKQSYSVEPIRKHMRSVWERFCCQIKLAQTPALRHVATKSGQRERKDRFSLFSAHAILNGAASHVCFHWIIDTVHWDK